jgi:hypothetical protein
MSIDENKNTSSQSTPPNSMSPNPADKTQTTSAPSVNPPKVEEKKEIGSNPAQQVRKN